MLRILAVALSLVACLQGESTGTQATSGDYIGTVHTRLQEGISYTIREEPVWYQQVNTPWGVFTCVVLLLLLCGAVYIFIPTHIDVELEGPDA